jgi:hypothetical protein
MTGGQSATGATSRRTAANTHADHQLRFDPIDA